MSRSDQYIGLSERAVIYLQRHCQMDQHIIMNNKGEIKNKSIVFDREPSTKYSRETIAGEDIPLDVFTLRNGKKVYEKVQEEIWASGPMYFTFLVDENDKPIRGTRWTKKEFETYI